MSFTKDNYNDNYITDKSGWDIIKKYIPTDKQIWSPFFCDGKQKEYFKGMGIDIIHEDRDFFKWNPTCDLLIDNPPFSKLRIICERLKQIDKPFIMLMPSSKINAVWFQKLFCDELQVIIPKKQIKFHHLNPNKKFSFNWGVYYYCYKMNLKKDLIFV